MNNVVTEQVAPATGQLVSKPVDFAKVDALRKHMLLTVASMCTLLGTSRVSYYGWLDGVVPRDKTAKHLREMLRKLTAVITFHNWPGPVVFVANQKERLVMLQDILKELDKEPAQQ